MKGINISYFKKLLILPEGSEDNKYKSGMAGLFFIMIVSRVEICWGRGGTVGSKAGS